MRIGLKASHRLERPHLAWSVNMQKRLSRQGAKEIACTAWGKLARRITNSPNVELISHERSPVESRRTMVRYRCRMPRVAVELLENDFTVVDSAQASQEQGNSGAQVAISRA
jgi:hypothetical protein